MTPLISVIIPAYNGQNYLSEAIDSVLEQTYKNIEIIIVDDGSTDQTAKIAAKYFNAVRYIYQSNKGLGASRNTGIQASHGNYLSFLDHDDLWEKNKLMVQMNVMLQHENDPIIFGHVKQFHCNTITNVEAQLLPIINSLLPGYHAGTMLLSRRRFNEIGYFIEKNQLGEFVDWYFRAHEKSIPIIMLNEILMFRRIHKNNMGLKNNVYSRTDYLKIIKTNLERRRNI